MQQNYNLDLSSQKGLKKSFPLFLRANDKRNVLKFVYAINHFLHFRILEVKLEIEGLMRAQSRTCNSALI